MKLPAAVAVHLLTSLHCNIWERWQTGVEGNKHKNQFSNQIPSWSRMWKPTNCIAVWMRCSCFFQFISSTSVGIKSLFSFIFCAMGLREIWLLIHRVLLISCWCWKEAAVSAFPHPDLRWVSVNILSPRSISPQAVPSLTPPSLCLCVHQPDTFRTHTHTDTSENSRLILTVDNLCVLHRHSYCFVKKFKWYGTWKDLTATLCDWPTQRCEVEGRWYKVVGFF